MTKRAIFIGRFSPFHKGHLSIMEKKIAENKPLLILVRDTHYDIYPAELRKRMIEAAFAKRKVDAKVVIIDDIESVNYGRGVGYEVNEIEVPENIKNISATDIRTKIENGDDSWKESMPDGADKVLEDYLSNSGIVIWFTGLPKSGKSTIANLVGDKLLKKGITAERLDGGILRKTVSKDLGFSKEDRIKNLERATFIAKLLSKNGAIVLCTFITPYESQREEIKKEIDETGTFIQVFVDSSLETCEKRDIEGLYEKAKKGEIEQFTGVSDPFQKPAHADITLNTEEKSAQECAEEIVKHVEKLI